MGWSEHFGNPEGLPGKLLLLGMNLGHGPVSRWGLQHVAWRENLEVLDIGCGGGANLRRMLKLTPGGHVTGIDISVTSVKKSQQVNSRDLGSRCDVVLSSVEDIPAADDSFDVVTAFETTYFWPDVERGFRECARVLRPGGTLLVTCELTDPESVYNRLVPGMEICSPARLEECFVQAGLTDITTDTRHGWVAITGTKEND